MVDAGMRAVSAPIERYLLRTQRTGSNPVLTTQYLSLPNGGLFLFLKFA